MAQIATSMRSLKKTTSFQVFFGQELASFSSFRRPTHQKEKTCDGFHHARMTMAASRPRTAASLSWTHNGHVNHHRRTDLSGAYYASSPPRCSFAHCSSSSFSASSFSTAATPSSAQPLPPLTPTNLPLTSLITPSTMESLQALPEIQSVLGILNGTSMNTTTPAQALTNLQRARDILQSLPELHSATYLLETELCSFMGNFQLALDALLRYQHLLLKHKMKGYKKHKMQLQFVQSKLLFHSGQFVHCLSEYEDLLESMERVVEQQMERRDQQLKEGKGGDAQTLPVLDGAAALTGVGLSQLLIYTSNVNGIDPNTDISVKDDIFAAIETSTDMLLESCKDAVASLDHSRIAIDLGLAASISLGNLGVAHHLLYNDGSGGGGEIRKSVQYWKQGIETLDTLLQRAVNSVTIIPRNKFLCMESVRARLHCNIAWALLRLDALERGDELPKVEDDNILKEASDAAKKALDIYDELINGPKILREGGISDDDGAVNKDEQTDETGYTNEDVENKKKFERLLKEEVKARKDQEKSGMGSPKPNELPLSPLWVDYHRSESARALGLLAHCYAQAGAAVTSEGLFQSALDASSSYPFGQRLGIARNSDNNDGVEKGVSRSSPSLGFIARDVRLCYASLCDNWEKRQGDADRLRLEAMKIQEEGVLKDFMASDDMESGRKDGIDATVQASKKMMSGIVTSLWLLNPLDFER